MALDSDTDLNFFVFESRAELRAAADLSRVCERLTGVAL